MKLSSQFYQGSQTINSSLKANPIIFNENTDSGNVNGWRHEAHGILCAEGAEKPTLPPFRVGLCPVSIEVFLFCEILVKTMISGYTHHASFTWDQIMGLWS